MRKVSNQEAMQEFIFALKPDALATAGGVVGIIDAQIDLLSDDLRHAKSLCFRERDVLNEAIGRIW